MTTEIVNTGKWPIHARPLLAWLDRKLERALGRAEARFGSAAASDPFRGLHLGLQEVMELLTCAPGDPIFAGESTQEDSAELLTTLVDRTSRFGFLTEAYQLGEFELGVLLMALAPEFDLRYQRLYAYLQDDVSRRGPSVDLVLNLLCKDAQEKLACRAAFSADALLLCKHLICLSPPADQVGAPLLTHEIRLDAQILRLLLGGEAIDGRFATFCALFSQDQLPNQLPFEDNSIQQLIHFTKKELQEGRTLRIDLAGPVDGGKRLLAAVLCYTLGLNLLLCDVPGLLSEDPLLAELPVPLAREAWLHQAALYFHGVDHIHEQEGHTLLRRLVQSIDGAPELVLFGGSFPWPSNMLAPSGLVRFKVPALNQVQRLACWIANLEETVKAWTPAAIDSLATYYKLAPTQIQRAVQEARSQARLEGIAAPDLSHLMAAARNQTRGRLEGLAQLVSTHQSWSDLIVPEDTQAQLREISERARLQWQVLEAGGFADKLGHGTGVNALFTGPSGTGKTMAAGLLAQSMGVDLYRINLSGVVSKYIGETEKNLDRIFQAAAGANAVLFFDEADALFGKRSEVRDSHDRYANIEISYLLQKMEEYEGVAILSTNMRQNIDEAFLRRLAFTVHFPFPDEESRLRIWQQIWPAHIQLAEDVDLPFLAQFKLSGGNIKNVALAAAFLAASDDGPVTMRHLLHAVGREYQKLGKPLNELHGQAAKVEEL